MPKTSRKGRAKAERAAMPVEPRAYLHTILK